ncbi:transposase zinc-binding domain-containing protein [Sorangium sp. So ce124]|uniref:transposase zinc-binding domain-containing protein n=1 Tax=Sorangium sp. So ce124 TaxID=3133280 RepID=UPI003F5E933B
MACGVRCRRRVASAARTTGVVYERRRPEKTTLYEIVRDNVETLYGAIDDGAIAVRIPKHAKKELEAYLDCGLLCRGFARLRCERCEESRLVAFSCKGRGFCPSCLGGRMCATAANLIEDVLPEVALRQWVLTFPVRLLSNALISSHGQLLCAAGEARAVRNGMYAAVELGGLGTLTCSGEVVPGELRYCHDRRLGKYAITGTLEGEPVVEVTGDHARTGDTLYLRVGWGVLIAKFAQQDTTETLVAGAYLSRGGELYCFDAASGDAHDIATADITFTGFRRADPCRADDPDTFARACVPQFEAGSDW